MEMPEKKITFGRIFWPSFLAVFIMSIIGILIFTLIIGGIIGSFGDFGPKPLAVKSNTILHMTLDGEITEKGKVDFNPMSFNLNRQIGLSDLLYGLEHAQKDDKIKGIFLEIGDISCGYSTAREIRNALNDFEKSGKFIVAYNGGEVITQKEYYISSAANEVYGFPTSAMEFIGLGTELAFFKGTLDKLDVEVQVIRGSDNDFKSAVEPFFRSYMSDSSRMQMGRYLTSIWEDVRQDIASDRKITPERLNEISDSVLIHRAEDAVDLHLLDGVKYRDEVIAMLNKKIGNDPDSDLNLQAFEKYARKKFYQNQVLTKGDNPNIAVILAEGDVATQGEGLTSEEICKLFQDVRKNKSIKTVVFRINSPGGSALASDEIWREVMLTNRTKKVIVSMGDVAASGGYYIAAPATAIFAEPTTITGSIGVFGMIPYAGKFFENKLGITFDRVATNKHAIMSLNRKLNGEELKIIQDEVDSIYTDFVSRVSEGRKLTVEQVKAIARGRVWTGKDALTVGLVDALGGLNDAIEYAAKKAYIKDKKILYYPLKKEDKLTQLIEEFEEDDRSDFGFSSSEQIPSELLYYYKELKKIEHLSGIQMRIPVDILLN
jgi:protease-4